jgi:hypothetical protein
VSREIGRTTTGMDAVALIRRYRVQGDTLRYETEMQTERTPMSRHLGAELRRVGV